MTCVLLFYIIFSFLNQYSQTGSNFNFFISFFKSFFQIDCYRLRKPADLLLVGWKDIVKDPSNIVVLEWPERVARLLPKDAITIHFSYAGEHKRTIAIT